MNVERRFNAVGDLVTASEAIVKVRVDGETLISAAEATARSTRSISRSCKGSRPVPEIHRGCELVDYRVRVFQGGTDAVTRVLIECADKDGERWSTVGVSANVIDAAFQALVDSINRHKLMVSGAKQSGGGVGRASQQTHDALAVGDPIRDATESCTPGVEARGRVDSTMAARRVLSPASMARSMNSEILAGRRSVSVIASGPGLRGAAAKQTFEIEIDKRSPDQASHGQDSAVRKLNRG